MPPLGKGSILKEMNLVPQGANSFFLERNPFLKELSVQESEQEVSKVLSSENGKQSTRRANRSFKSSLLREWQAIYQESKQEVTKVVSSENGKQSTRRANRKSQKLYLPREWQAIYQERNKNSQKLSIPREW